MGYLGVQFNVNCVLGVCIVLGFVLMLMIGNIEDFLVIYQFFEGDIVQEVGQVFVQVVLQCVSQVFIVVLIVVFVLVMGGVNGFVYGVNDFVDGDIVGIFI